MDLRDYIYYCDNSRGSTYCHYKFENILEYYENNDGVKLYARTKDVYPQFFTIVEGEHIDIERIREDFTLKLTSKALRKAISKYDKANCKQYLLKLNSKTDRDIIDYMDQLENKQGFIKELIRKEISGEKNNKIS